MSGPAAVPGNAGRADYPRMIYHPDGRQRIVATPEEENALLPEGWRQQPAPVHSQNRPTPSVVAGVNDPIAHIVRNIIETVLDERGLTRETVTALKQAATAPEEESPASVPLPPRSHHRRT